MPSDEMSFARFVTGEFSYSTLESACYAVNCGAHNRYGFRSSYDLVRNVPQADKVELTRPVSKIGAITTEMILRI